MVEHFGEIKHLCVSTIVRVFLLRECGSFKPYLESWFKWRHTSTHLQGCHGFF